MAEIIRVTKQGGIICIIAPNGFGEHRYPVDCWRFFTDGMVALAKFYNLEIIHAHTNAAPNTSDIEWYSEECADSMLIARKPYAGKAQQVNLSKYTCKPECHEELMGEMKSYKEYQAIKYKEDENRTKLERCRKKSIDVRAAIKQRLKTIVKGIRQRKK